MIRSSAIVSCCIIYKQTKVIGFIVKLVKQFTTMSRLINLLCLVSANAIIGNKVESFLLNGHANVSGSPPDNGYYNIYSKIDYLERVLQNLETSVQQKETHMDTLLRQVLLTVNEMDAKIESSGLHKIESNELRLQNMSLEMDQLKALTTNGNSMFHMIYGILITSITNEVCKI